VPSTTVARLPLVSWTLVVPTTAGAPSAFCATAMYFWLSVK